MSISPHKDVKQINWVGNKLSKKYGVDFLIADWKKNDGFKIGSKMSKEEGFYRQDYCGCLLSLEESKLRSGQKHGGDDRK